MFFERESETGLRTVRRTLFGLMNPYPQKKIITFNKHVDDFSFAINYAELDHLPVHEIQYLGSPNISEVALEGVAAALKKHTGDNSELKGIKAHFGMDESGVLSLLNVDLVVEKTVMPDSEEESPLSKLGSTITKLFTGEGDNVPEKPSDEKPVTEEQPKQTQKPEEAQKNDTETKNTTQTEKSEPKKPKVVTIKEPIKSTERLLTVNELTEEEFQEASKKLEHLNEVDRELNRRATALNNLESFVIDIQTKLYEDEYIEASTEEEREAIAKMCSEISDWLYEDGADADADTYEKKLNELRELSKDLYYRVYEHKERPEALSALHSMLNGTRHFLTHAMNLTKDTNPEKDIFTSVEIETLKKLIEETEEWRDKAVEDQNALKKHEPVKLTVKTLSEKMSALDREVKYLVNKMKLWKPKKTDKKKKEEEKEEEVIKPVVEEPEYANDEVEVEVEPSKTKDDSESHTEL